MNDLNTLLDRAAGPATAPVDAHADLTRGHRALARTRRRRARRRPARRRRRRCRGRRRVPDGPAGRHAAAAGRGDDQTRDDGGIRFLAQPFEAGPYTFDQTPEGWEVQGAYPQGVTIAPVGFPDQEPASFVGKLVIMFDGNPLSGEQVELDGRTFWVRGDSGYTTIATRTLPGEPEGNVLDPVPERHRLDPRHDAQFLAGVHVGPGAQQGLG